MVHHLIALFLGLLPGVMMDSKSALDIIERTE